MPETTDSQPMIDKMIKRYTFFMIIYIIIIALLVIAIAFNKNSATVDYKIYDKEIKTLHRQLDSMQRVNDIYRIQADSIQSDIANLKQQRLDINQRINNYDKKLNTIQGDYEKISHYTNLSADSLRILFAEKFGQ